MPQGFLFNQGTTDQRVNTKTQDFGKWLVLRIGVLKNYIVNSIDYYIGF
jgi:hypothetical protein